MTRNRMTARLSITSATRSAIDASATRLERLLPRLVGPARDVFAVTHAATRGNARVAAVVGWLARVLAEPV